MKFCFFLSSLNPLSLMKSTRFFRNFVFLFSLLGLGSFSWGERYETVFVYTSDTAAMSHTNAEAYIKSVLSSQTLSIPQGQVAYLHDHKALTKPEGSVQYGTYYSGSAMIRGFVIDYTGLDSNVTTGSWNQTNNFEHSTPIVGPAVVRIWMRPAFVRETQSYVSNGGFSSQAGNWDFYASEGFVTFRIEGSEQAPSKKFATVIPENASGNIRVVLEQSTDLINWTSATPGVFPPSTSKRFFRVRSEEE
jgi:hypothetical protein